MRTPSAPPHLVPDPAAVTADPWTALDGAPLPDRLEHWDPFTRTDLGRIVTIDADRIRSECELGSDATFAVAASWYSSTTRLSGGPPTVELADLPGLLRVDIQLSMPGDSVGGRVELRTALILRHPGESPGPVSPRTSGTILWRDTATVAVEGSASRFPVSAVDFVDSPYDPDAAWALDWEPGDLNRQILGGLRLIVNRAHPTILEILGAGSADPRHTAVQSYITYDVARTMVLAALHDDDFRRSPGAYEEGTVGRTISDLLDQCWPGVPALTLAQWAADSPARIDTRLQSHLRTLA